MTMEGWGNPVEKLEERLDALIDDLTLRVDRMGERIDSAISRLDEKDRDLDYSIMDKANKSDLESLRTEVDSLRYNR